MELGLPSHGFFLARKLERNWSSRLEGARVCAVLFSSTFGLLNPWIEEDLLTSETRSCALVTRMRFFLRHHRHPSLLLVESRRNQKITQLQYIRISFGFVVLDSRMSYRWPRLLAHFGRQSTTACRRHVESTALRLQHSQLYGVDFRDGVDTIKMHLKKRMGKPPSVAFSGIHAHELRLDRSPFVHHFLGPGHLHPWERGTYQDLIAPHLWALRHLGWVP